MKKEEFYTGVKVIENFNKINELYTLDYLSIDQFQEKLYPNQCLVIKGGNHQSALAIVRGDKVVKIDENQLKLFNITPKNKEQMFVAHMLKNCGLDLNIVTGCAGSGKTLMALAYAMESLKKGDYKKLVLSKSLAPVGREVGFLKGTMMDKVLPWLGSYYDNLEVLGIPDYEIDIVTPGNDNAHSMMDKKFEKSKYKIEISPITFIQGRSISNAIIIIDEVQNLSTNVVSQILTRPANNSKVILLGDLEQIFEKHLSKEDNGLYSAIMNGIDTDFIGSIHMLKSERSRLAQWAWENLK